MKNAKITIIFLALLCCSLVFTGCKETKKEKATSEAVEVKADAKAEAAKVEATKTKTAAEVKADAKAEAAKVEAAKVKAAADAEAAKAKAAAEK
jgi:colicin import membrane protein